MADLPRSFHFFHISLITVLQPQTCRNISGLGSFPFARHYLGNHSYFLFLRLLRCFSSAGSLPALAGCHVFNMTGCPIRKSSDLILFANPRSLSQLITSFLASESLGIPRVLFLTFFHTCAFCYAWCACDCCIPTTSLLSFALLVSTSSNMSKNFPELYLAGG